MQSMCVVCQNPVESYSCSKKRCALCLGLKTSSKVPRVGAGYCAYCGMFTCKLTRDHIVPKSKGGSGDKSNIAYVCRECNQSKADMMLYEWAKI